MGFQPDGKLLHADVGAVPGDHKGIRIRVPAEPGEHSGLLHAVGGSLFNNRYGQGFQLLHQLAFPFPLEAVDRISGKLRAVFVWQSFSASTGRPV